MILEKILNRGFTIQQMKRAPLTVSLCIYLNLTLLRIAFGIVFGS